MNENLALQRYTSNLLTQLQLKPEQYLKPLSIDYLTEALGFSNSPFWQRYIIDLDNPTRDCLSPDNPLYRHTPRIFMLNGDTPVFYIEILRSRILTQSRDFTTEIEKAVAFCLEQGIDAHYKTVKDVSIVEECDRVKIRFRRFRDAQAEVL